MEIKEIQNLIKFVAKSGVSEVKIEDKDFKITIKNKQEFIKTATPEVVMPQQMLVSQTPVTPTVQVASTTTVEQPSTNEDNSKYITIKAPIIGTFYRKPAPDKPPFIKVGDTIKEGDVVCIIEAMKLFNEIESEFSGKIIKVLVEDATPVEFDQPLFLVEPI